MLVCGGAGFIGKHFVGSALQQHPDWEIVILDAFTYAADSSLLEERKAGITVVKGDICDVGRIFEDGAGFDLVVNFAAESHVDNSLRNADDFVRTNVIGVQKLVEFCLKWGIRLHQVSTDEVFGDAIAINGGFCDEFSPIQPSNPYSASKAGGDLFIWAAVRSHGLRATISYGSNTYGPGQHVEKLIPSCAEKVTSGTPVTVYGDGSHTRDWIHVDDHCAGILRILELGGMGHAYCLPGGNEKTNLEIVSSICAILGRPNHPVEFVRDRPGHDLCYRMSGRKAKQELGWEPMKKTLDLAFLSAPTNLVA